MNQETCQVTLHTDIRELVTIDLDTASDTDARLLANQILARARAEALTTLPGRLDEQLSNGTPDDIRTFLKTRMWTSWTTDLRIAVSQTMSGAGDTVRAAAQEALDNGTVDAFLGYLNRGLYLALAQAAGALKLFQDIGELVTIDLDTASDTNIRLLANQILARIRPEALTTLPGRLDEQLSNGTPDDIRAFLKTRMWTSWTTDLRIAANQTIPGAGTNVQATAQEALDNDTIDTLLDYLNRGLYIARTRDCVYQRP
ncbi:hypothetical protein [Lentzea sp. NPDC059081]|uniref:hypothetical protein n=1 Tax=Lentzea sp. NPDC059081 TaxID=3346719 RepID=UPI0036C9B3C1